MPYRRFHAQHEDRDSRRAYIREVIPEAFTEAGVDWGVLRDAVEAPSNDTADEPEHYGLSWPGKREARRLSAIPSHGTLIPIPKRGVDEYLTRNVFIEGDNLEVLKILQKSYADRVKMIYIDPPYNTGNDFIYDDDYSDTLGDYLRRTEQVDEQGRLLTTNTRSDGRFHSKWLSMMYPRLRLMHNLLTADGAIFISIDDNEGCRLRQIMDEIFGEENFVAQIVIQNNPRGRHLDRFIARTHDYVIVYAKDITQHALFEVEKDARMSAEYRYKDARGDYRELELRNRNPAFNRITRPNLYYPIYVDPQGGNVSLDRSTRYSVAVYPKNSKGEDSCWTWGKIKLAAQAGDIVAHKAADGTWRVFRKDYLLSETGERATTMPKSLWLERDLNNDVGKKAVQELFAGQSVFDFPKPVPLLRKLITIGAGPNDLVCDFFSGAATTAQAVLEANQASGTNRKFMLVQLPAPVPPDSVAASLGFDKLSTLAEERIRRVVEKLRNHAKDMARKGLGIEAPGSAVPDRGFRVFSLGESNMIRWRDYEGNDVNELRLLFDAAANPLAEDWTPESLLTEVMLTQGFPLDSSIRWSTVNGRRIAVVRSPDHDHRLFACFDKKLDPNALTGLDMTSEDILSCLDSALDDELKLRLSDSFNVVAI